MQEFYKIPNGVGLGQPVIGNNSETFSKGDPVTKNGDGFLELAAAGEKILGWCLEDIVMASNNETVAKVCPQYVPAVPGVQMKMTSDQACTQTDLDAYADIVGTTSGSIQVNLAAGSTGQLAVLAFDPEGEGDTDTVIVEVAEPQNFAFAQS